MASLYGRQGAYGTSAIFVMTRGSRKTRVEVIATTAASSTAMGLGRMCVQRVAHRVGRGFLQLIEMRDLALACRRIGRPAPVAVTRSHDKRKIASSSAP
jgi:hypothetical protein